MSAPATDDAGSQDEGAVAHPLDTVTHHEITRNSTVAVRSRSRMLPRREGKRLSKVWIAAGVWVAAWPALARAEAGTVEIAWSAPADCPTTPDVEASVRDLLGRPPHLPDGRNLKVQVRAERKHDRGWSGTIETRLGTTTGSRTIATESCRAVADATALIVALMIDPDAVAARASPPATASPPQEPSRAIRAPPAATDTAVSRAPSPSRRDLAPRFSLGPTVAVDLGTLPRPSYGAGARVGVKVGRSALELGVLASASARATIAGTAPPAGGSFHFWAASLSACPAFAVRRFDIGACAEIEAVEVKGTGFGVTAQYENDARWLALGAGAIARLRISPHVAIPFRMGVVAPLGHPTFVLKGVTEGQGQIYSPSRAAVRALLAVDVDF